MPRAKATDGLSEAAQNAMAQGFASGRSAAAVAQAVRAATGENVAERTIARRAAEWRESKARFERAKEQYAAMKAGGMDGGEMIQALAFERLLQPDALTGADPVEFHKLGLEAEKIALKKREIEVRERAMAVDERKVAMLEAREKRAVAVLQGEDKVEMTAEERVKAIKEIYGIRS